MKNHLPSFLILIVVGVLSSSAYAQVGIGTETPSSKAVLELVSPGNNQGFLVPRLTSTQRNAMSLSAADKGMLVFDSVDNKFYYWNGTAWIVIEDSVGTGTVTNILTGAGLTGGPISVTGTISIADNGVTDAKIAGVAPSKISAGGASNGQVLKWNGTNWIPQADNPGTDAQALTYTPATGLLAISGGNNVTITGTVPGGAAGGDLTGSYPNPTIAANAVASAEITDGSITSADINDGTLTNADINASAAIAVTKVAAGTNGQVLTTVAGATAWATAPTATGTAGGDLTGTYPNPAVASSAISTAKLADGAVTDVKIASVAPSKISAGGAANGQVLKWNGTNWTPQADNGGTDAQTLTYTPATGLLAITGGNNVTITGTVPGGAAGGDLTGTFPNPTIAAGAVASAEITDGSITSVDINDGTLTNADINASAAIAVTKVAAGTNGQVLTTVGGVPAWATAPTASGTAGGDLTGTYPNPTVANSAVTTAKLADAAVTDVKIASVAPSKLSAGGAANGQVLKWNGTNWTPQADNGGTDAQTLTYTPATGLLAISGGNNVTITGTAPGGAAGGDLTGTYPNPTLATGAVNSAEILDGAIATADLADNSITSVKVVDGTLTNTDISATAAVAVTKMAPGTNGQVLTTVAGATAWATAPTATGTANGDLSGTYPNPTVDGLQGRAVAVTAPTTGQVLKWDGSAWTPATDATGGGGVGGGGAPTQIAYWGSTTNIGGKNAFVFDEKDNRVGINVVNPLGNLHVMGSQFVNHVVISDDYVVKETDYSLVVSNTAKPVAIELPEIDPGNIGRVLIIRSLNSAAVKLVGFGGKERIQTDEDLVTTYDMGIGNGEFLTMTIIGTQMAGGPRWMVVSGIRSRVK